MTPHLDPHPTSPAYHGDRGPSWEHRLIRVDHGPHAGHIGWCRDDDGELVVIDPNDGPHLLRVRRADCSPVIGGEL